MYQEHFGLERKPFQIAADPDFLWLGEKHREALATLTYGVRGRKGFLLLTGEVGSGKTTLVNALLQRLGDEVVSGVVSDPRMPPLDLLNAVAAAFGLPTRYADKAMFLGDFRHFLELVNRAGQQVLLIVDEAQRLDSRLLEEIRLLSNIEWHSRKLIDIFFVGQSEFLDLLGREENRALRQRIALHHRLPFLRLEETAELIRHRLRQAGARRPIFSLEAFPPIQAFSQGAPRLINIVCDQALLTAYFQGRMAVTADIVAECVDSLRLPGEAERLAARRPVPAAAPASAAAEPAGPPWPVPSRPPRPWRSPWGLALAALAGLAAAGGFYAAGWRQNGNPGRLVSNAAVQVEALGQAAPAPRRLPALPPEAPFGHALPGEAIPGAPSLDPSPPAPAVDAPAVGGSTAAAPTSPAVRDPRPSAAPPSVPPADRPPAAPTATLAATAPPPPTRAAQAPSAPPRPAAPVAVAPAPATMAAPETPAPPPPDPAAAREERLRSFLASYCQAYEGRDLESFCALFAPEAREQGIPFQEVIPRYRENFARLEALDYRIALTGSHLPPGGGGLGLTGDFLARYRLRPGGPWRESRGRLAMELVEVGGELKVRRLDYAKE